jgi:hypothetical protein
MRPALYLHTSTSQQNQGGTVLYNRQRRRDSPEPVVRVAIWSINRQVVHGQSAVSGEAAPMLHVFSS